MHITMIPKKQLDFLTSLMTNNQSRSIVTSLALAKVLGDNVALPLGKVESIDAHYDFTYKYSNSQVLGAINEIAMLDISTVYELAKKIYGSRYATAYPDGPLLMMSKDKATLDFFGITRVFSDEILTAITENNIKLMDYYSNFKEIVNVFTSKHVDVLEAQYD
jgi:hypothetical protein